MLRMITQTPSFPPSSTMTPDDFHIPPSQIRQQRTPISHIDRFASFQSDNSNNYNMDISYSHKVSTIKGFPLSSSSTVNASLCPSNINRRLVDSLWSYLLVCRPQISLPISLTVGVSLATVEIA